MRRIAMVVGVLGVAAAPLWAQTGAATGAKQGQTAGREGKAQAGSDNAFLREAAMGGMAEVELGRLATTKAENADVKQFGQRMVDDHGKANDELKSLASKKNVSLPTELDAAHKAVSDRLSKLSGAAFDRAYMRDMVQDHNKDVAAFTRASRSAHDADVKAWAAKTLPTLQDHQKLARDINAKLGSGAKGKPKTTKSRE
jgi:putative membrane protein